MTEGVTDDGARVRVAAALVIHGGRVLVQTRPEGRHYEGYWEFPGGKLEAEESVEDCAVRECREELGLDVEPLSVLQEVNWSYPGRRVHVTFVRCRVPGGEAPRPHPHDGQELRWADAEDLRSLRFLPANAEVIERLLAGPLA